MPETVEPASEPASPAAGRRWRLPMGARSAEEPHRASTPLELLFDLTFVVAIAAAAAELGHAVADDHLGHGVVGFVMVFFAIWWAWMNFTWFASAYDSDDVPYRLLTLLQMAGVLVLAAGVPAAFDDTDYTAVTVGYVIMRVAMVTQWVRAGRGDRASRATAYRYALGTAVIQAGWLARLALPDTAGLIAFFVLVPLELAVPPWAERAARTSWHPHHIAERYGLFVIIVLGESVLAASRALAPAVEAGATTDTVLLGAGGLLLLFGCWWLYFAAPAGHGLARHPERAFGWGYGHYGVFAALAALGAGLEVAAETLVHHIKVSDGVVGFAIALPVIVFLLLVWVLHAPLHAFPITGLGVVIIACGALAAIAAAAAAGLPLPWFAVLAAVPVWALVALVVVLDDRRARAA
ncbi:low temperature requirement protein A [Frankia sp. R43]|uniref:low temperature requirement protein A n=1 Tax=Frankia sp. R43 TaxID=269536 RepID=UPI0006CA3DB1|nr:low temperature requirement protein A [Frankia sp. R43]KPM55343.1 low temperature requirement protein A [Frankia sp. R43]